LDLRELGEHLKGPELKERFYEEVATRLNIRDRSTMKVIRFLIEFIVVEDKSNDWCLMKTLYARTRLRISINEFYYSIIPKLVTIGLVEMQMLTSPTGGPKRVVRLSESYTSEVLGPILKYVKNNEKGGFTALLC
jgi:hypothetical protein